MNYRLATDLPNQVPAGALSGVGGEISELLSSPAAIRALPPDVAVGVTTSVEMAVHEVFVWCVPPMVLGFVLSWFLREIPLRETIGAASLVEGTGEVVETRMD